MATVPLSGTNIRLLSGVPFSNDYKHTRYFVNLSSQNTYFGNRNIIHSMTQANFQRIEGKHFIKVDASIDDLWGTNYLMFQNAQYNNKWFYGFVTNLEYRNPGCTLVHFEIDVLQTWLFDFTFKPSFVAREHCKLWNSDGSPVINTVDEGLNYGTEYETSFVYNWQPNNSYKWLVIVSKEVMHVSSDVGKIIPNVLGTPQPLTYYVLPFKDDDTVANVVPTIGGGAVLSKPSQVLTNLYKGDNATDNIVSIYVTDHIGLATSTSGNTITFTNASDKVESCAILSDPTDSGSSYFSCIHVISSKSFSPLTQNLGNKWTGFTEVDESKLLMYPYTQLQIVDFKGNVANFKTEYINNSDLVLSVKGSLGTSNKVSYEIQDYNFDANGYKSEVSDQYALINNTPNDIPIITDMLSAYLQGNKNSLQTQVDTAFLHGTMGLIGSGVGGVASALSGNAMGMVSSGVGMANSSISAQQQIEAIHSKKMDIANLPPSISKQGSNTSYELGNKYDGIYVIKKQIKEEYIEKLTDYFKMYGYKMNQVKVPNFNTRRSFNYVQTISCNITGNFNNNDLKELKSIFDNGITLWHTDDVGNYDLANEVV